MVGGGHRTLTSLRPTDFRISYGLRRLVMRVRAGDEFVWDYSRDLASAE